jgi:hypothetical protein
MSAAAQPYEALARQLELELQLVAEGDLERLEQLQHERGRLLAELPAIPPAVARAALERAALLSGNVGIELLRSCQRS